MKKQLRLLLLYFFAHPISVADQHSTNLNLSLSVGQQTMANGQTVFLETEIRPAQPYVQAQITYIVRVFYLGRLLQINLTTPDLNNADMQIIADKRGMESTRQKQKFSLWQRKYAVFAEQSGLLHIPPLRITARIAQKRSSVSGILQSHTSELRTAPAELTVQARPSGFSATDWLPAQQLQLFRLPINQTVQTGLPIDHTIVLQAKGLRGFQLPDIQLGALAWANSYVNNVLTENLQTDTHIIGRREMHFTLIPQHPGTVSLPEIRLSWWNTQTKTQETAILPTHVLTVTGQTHAPETMPSELSATTGAPRNTWFLLCTALVTLCLLTLFAWLRNSARRKR